MFETCDTRQDLHAYTLELQFAMFHSCYSAFSILQCLKMVFSGYAKQWILFYHLSEKSSMQIDRCVPKEMHTVSNQHDIVEAHCIVQ